MKWDEVPAEQPPASRPEPDLLRHVFRSFPTGVVAITATEGGQPLGFAVNSFTSASLDPPLVLFCAAKSSTTWPGIRAARRFAANVLSRHQAEVCARFARRGEDRFAGLAWRPSPLGNPILDECVAWLDCGIEAIYEAGDHEVVLGRVESCSRRRSAPPLVFHRGGYTAVETVHDAC